MGIWGEGGKLGMKEEIRRQKEEVRGIKKEF